MLGIANHCINALTNGWNECDGYCANYFINNNELTNAKLACDDTSVLP